MTFFSHFSKAVCAACVLSLFAGCEKKSAATGAPSAEVQPLAVAVQNIESTDMEAYIDFSGTVKALDTVTVYPAVAGKVARILVGIGDKVSRNQVIAQVDPSKPGAEFMLSAVRASAAGTITDIPVSVGSYVTASGAVAEIASTASLEVTVQVSEKFVPYIKAGQTAEVSFSAYPGETFSAAVTKLSPVLNPATRTMAVTLALKETRGIVKAGMFARVRLVTERRENVLAVPSSALLSSGGKQFVFVAEGGRARKVGVETGLEADGSTEIVSGLRKGNAVIVRGQNMLSDGQVVREAQ